MDLTSPVAIFGRIELPLWEMRCARVTKPLIWQSTGFFRQSAMSMRCRPLCSSKRANVVPDASCRTFDCHRYRTFGTLQRLRRRSFWRLTTEAFSCFLGSEGSQSTCSISNMNAPSFGRELALEPLHRSRLLALAVGRRSDGRTLSNC